jgi:hypothetical protein
MTSAHSGDVALTENQLGPLGPQIGQGGQAKVFDLPALTLPDAQGRLVYKQYRPNAAPLHGMSRVVALRTRLAAHPVELARLDAATAWPVRQVVDSSGAVLGLVLPRIPDSYFEDLRLPSGGHEPRQREVQYLIIPPDRALRLNMPTPTPEQRLRICRDFAGALAFLHGELAVTFGDINARNALFRLDAEPTVMLIDCDAVRVRGEMATLKQLNAPDWDPPEGADVLSQATDLYKLGLFVLRCLTPGLGSSVNRDPAVARGALDNVGLDLLRHALTGPPGGRPSAETWHRYLRRRLGEALAPPRLTRVDPDRTIVAAGEPVVLTWAAEDADTIELTGVGIPPTSVPGLAGTGTVTLRPTRTGTVGVVARNTLGTDELRTGPVAVFDVASFVDLPVPMPTLDLPPLTPPELPSVSTVIPPFPRTERLPVPASVSAFEEWTVPDLEPPPQPLDPAGRPPALGFGASAIPVDLTAIMTAAPDDGADRDMRP